MPAYLILSRSSAARSSSIEYPHSSVRTRRCIYSASASERRSASAAAMIEL